VRVLCARAVRVGVCGGVCVFRSFEKKIKKIGCKLTNELNAVIHARSYLAAQLSFEMLLLSLM